MGMGEQPGPGPEETGYLILGGHGVDDPSRVASAEAAAALMAAAGTRHPDSYAGSPTKASEPTRPMITEVPGVSDSHKADPSGRAQETSRAEYLQNAAAQHPGSAVIDDVPGGTPEGPKSPA